MSSKPQDQHPSEELSLKQVAEKTKLVTDEIVTAEEELTVAHAVLEKKLPLNSKEPEVRQAVEATKQVKKRLQKSAKELTTVQVELEKRATK